MGMGEWDLMGGGWLGWLLGGFGFGLVALLHASWRFGAGSDIRAFSGGLAGRSVMVSGRGIRVRDGTEGSMGFGWILDGAAESLFCM